MYVNGKEHTVTIGNRTFHCAVDVTLGFVGGKWKTVVLFYLMEGTKRYSELKQLMPEITDKMLSKQLRELERDGFIARQKIRPLWVEYSLTEEGHILEPLLNEIAAWGRRKAAAEGTMHVVEVEN